MTREEEMKNKDNNNKEYEKDLNELKEQILKDGDTSVSKRDLLERFCEIDKEYNGEPWNLLQILSNINVLIGEEPCDELDFVQPHKKVSVNLEPCEDAISREELKKWLDMNFSFGGASRKIELFNRLDKELPSVVPKGVTVTDFADKCRECGKLKKKYNEKN